MSADEVITWESLEARMKSLFRIKYKEWTKDLEWLKSHAEHPAQKLKIVNLYVHVQNTLWMNIDYMDVPSLMPLEVWINSIKNMLEMLDILVQNPIVIVGGGDDFNLEWIENYKKGPEFEGKVQIIGDLSDLVVGLNYHFWTGLTHTDPDTDEHKKWLLQEQTLYVLCENVLEYLVRAGQSRPTAEVARILHTIVYYKTSELYSALHYKCERSVGNDDLKVIHQRLIFRGEQDEWMTELRGLVFTFGDKLLQDIVKLCDICHWALVNNFSKAMDGMLCFLRQEGNNDYLIQFDINRALAQLGLCAFRVGRIAEAYSCLSWLYGGGRVDILLGQAHTHLPIDEIFLKPRERHFQIPHHMHIDLQALEQVYSICAMLLKFSNRDEVANQEFVTDIHGDVLAGIQALRRVNVSDTIKFIEGLELWELLKEGGKLLEFVKIKIREVAFINQQQLFHIDPNSIEAGNQFEIAQGRRYQLIHQCFSSGKECPITFFAELTERLSFFALNHRELFEGNIRAHSDSSSILVRAPSLGEFEISSIPLSILRLFLCSEGLEA